MRQHPAEVWAEARRLVVAEGWTYAKAAEATGISASTISKRAAREEWQTERDSTMGYAAQVRAIKHQMSTRILDKLADPDLSADGMKAVTQLIHAWKNAESAFPEHRYKQAEADPKAILGVALNVLERLVEYLAANDTNALAALEPHLEGFARVFEREVTA